MVARVFYHGVRMKLKCKPKYNNYENLKKKVGQKPQTLGREAVDNEGSLEPQFGPTGLWGLGDSCLLKTNMFFS